QAGATKKNGGDEKPVQAGARAQPEKPPAQHIAKPGHESELALAPQFLAPDYRGSGKLEGFAAIVTGADSGIGRDVAVNNAAFQEHAESIEDITEERLEETFRTNIFGYFHMAQAALPHLKEG